MVRLVDARGITSVPSAPDPALLSLLVKARQWWAMLGEGKVNIQELARAEGVTPSWLTRVVRCAFLSPHMVEAILDGRARAGCDAKTLLGSGAIAASWFAQEQAWLGARRIAKDPIR